MRKPLILFGLAALLLVAMPLLVAARPGSGDRFVVRDHDGRHVVIRGDDFTDEDWQELEAAMEELGESLGEMFEDLDVSLDLDFDDHRGWSRHGDHAGRSFERLGERMGRLGERLARRFDRFGDDYEVYVDDEDWDDFGERLSERIERQVNQGVIEDIQRDVARALDLRLRDVDRFDEDTRDLSDREARQLRRHLERQMRRLEREMEQLQRRLADIEDR
jgi:hypothetical protein